jgi:hypothetical protein
MGSPRDEVRWSEPQGPVDVAYEGMTHPGALNALSSRRDCARARNVVGKLWSFAPALHPVDLLGVL